MSRNQRLALVAAAVVVAVVAFVIASPGDDDDSADRTNTTAASTTPADGEGGTDTATTPAEPEEPAEPPQPDVARISIKAGEVEGGVRNIDVTKGDEVRIVVTSDAPDEIHLHGYDVEREVAPGKPGSFRFTADVEGVFEIESHTAEDAGKSPLVAKLVVEPS